MRNKILGCLVALAAAALITGCESKDDKKGATQAAKTQVTPAAAGMIETQKADANATAQKDYDQFMSYDINGKKRVKFGLDDEESETSRSVGALAMVRSPLQSINLKLIKGQLSKDFIVKCSACHDDYANGIIGPSLLNKTSDQIYDMIFAYKNKQKANPLMKDLVQPLDEAQIRALANEISEFNEQFRKK